MWIWERYLLLSGEAKTLVVSIVGAIAGALVKWLFDRKLIRALKLDRDDARKDREAANRARQKALKDREKAIAELAEKKHELTQREQMLDQLESELKVERDRLDRLLDTLRSSDAGLWNTFSRSPPFPDFDARVGRRKPIILTVANNKGGVGKTTVVGNLLAYFDKHRKMRVLAIDMDYQGSLTTLLRAEQDQVGPRASNVNALLARGAGPATLLTATRGLGTQFSRSKLVPAFYELALLEDRLMVEWLLQENNGDDVRYRLANVLFERQVQDAFDIVLIDVPPRLSTGTINALCASTHLLIPSIFNPVAAEPVANFLTASKALLDTLNPKLDFVGVVETMAPPANQGQGPRALGRNAISEALLRFPGVTILDTCIPRRQPMSEGGVAYVADREVRKVGLQ
jgi:cellulose biosynthesis protein BcsQ